MVILFVSLLILMILCLNIEKNEYVAPAFIFCASFVFSCAWATVYAREWSLNLHFNTYSSEKLIRGLDYQIIPFIRRFL